MITMYYTGSSYIRLNEYNLSDTKDESAKIAS